MKKEELTKIYRALENKQVLTLAVGIDGAVGAAGFYGKHLQGKLSVYCNNETYTLSRVYALPSNCSAYTVNEEAICSLLRKFLIELYAEELGLSTSGVFNHNTPVTVMLKQNNYLIMSHGNLVLDSRHLNSLEDMFKLSQILGYLITQLPEPSLNLIYKYTIQKIS